LALSLSDHPSGAAPVIDEREVLCGSSLPERRVRVHEGGFRQDPQTRSQTDYPRPQPEGLQMDGEGPVEGRTGDPMEASAGQKNREVAIGQLAKSSEQPANMDTSRGRANGEAPSEVACHQAEGGDHRRSVDFRNGHSEDGR